MAVMPQTTVRLLDVPFDITNKHQMDFATFDAQFNYMNSRPGYTYENVTYQRHPSNGQSVVRIDKNVDELNRYNYCMYKNTGFSDKWFYAFVTKMEYVNTNTTYVYITFDPWQTWQFDITFKPCFVEREMVLNDNAASAVIDEGLEHGDYLISNAWRITELEALKIIVGSTVNLDDSSFPNTMGRMYLNYSGITFFAYDRSGDDLNVLRDVLNRLNQAGKIDAVQMMFMYPAAFINIESGHMVAQGWTSTGITYDYGERMAKSTIDGYTPKNKKLLYYPYRSIYVSNNSGGAAEYRIEYFTEYNTSGNVVFRARGGLSPSSTIELTPQDYRGNTPRPANELALSMPPLPLCSWNSDTYANWLAQNNASINNSKAVALRNRDMQGDRALYEGITGVISNTLSMNAFGMLDAGGSAVQSAREIQNNYENTISGIMATVQDHQVQPPQSRGTGSTSSAQIKGALTFTLYTSQIKREFAERLDNYFDMFGYKVNNVKIPNIKNRPYWNYVKTVDANIIGSIPNADLQGIKGMFNNGVTIWHDPTSFGDYSKNNH